MVGRDCLGAGWRIHTSSMKERPCLRSFSSWKACPAREPISSKSPNVSLVKHDTVRWVRQNKSTLLEKVFLNYLHVKQEEGQGSRR